MPVTPQILTNGAGQIPVTSSGGSAGQQPMANSSPVVVASDQSPIAVTGMLTDTQLRATAVPVTATQGTAAAASAPWAFRVSDGTSFYDISKTGQFPSALIGGRFDTNNGAWLGSTAPTVGQKTMANSLPVVIASDQTVLSVSGPLTDAQLRNSAVPVSAASLPLPSGASTETTLASRLADATFTGRINTQGQKAMAASTPVVIASDQSAMPVTAAQLPSALVGARLDTNNGAWLGSTAPTVGSKTSANSVPVVIASDQGAVPVSGTVTANQGTPAAAANAWPAKISDGTNSAALSNAPPAGTEQGLIVRVIDKPTTLHVTATAAVNTASTCTLPAAGAGLFHYITNIQLVKLYSIVGVAAGAGVIVTSTNLPGNPAWTTEQLASAAGTAPVVINFSYPGNPLRSSVANTATTFVAPLQLQTIWRWNVSYYTGN